MPRGTDMHRRTLLAGLAAAACTACARPPEAPRLAALAPAGIAPVAPPPPRYADILRALGVAWTPPADGVGVLVNIPSFDLVAFRDGEPALTSRVVVGAPRTPTPLGDVASGVVRFRPTWRPTPRMIAEGLYEDGVRPPGPSNPLGLAAIRFAEGGEIYLHGTNSPQYFERRNRALSSGCVRVERIEELVALVLGWEVERARREMRRGGTRDVPTPPAPIHFGHYLAFALPGEAPADHAPVYA